MKRSRERTCRPRQKPPSKAIGHCALICALLLLGRFSPPVLAIAHVDEENGKSVEKIGPALAHMNEMCPVMTENKADPEVSVEYGGGRIFLCCSRCKKQFFESPQKYFPSLARASATDGTGGKPASAVPLEVAAQNAPHEHIEDRDNADETHAVPPADHASGVTGMQEQNDKNIGDKHDHAADHGQADREGRVIRFAGKFHPAAVHFPIALIVTAALAELLGVLRRRIVFLEIAFYTLLLGAASAIVTVGLGWAAAAYANYPEMEWVLDVHRILGTAAGGATVLAAGCAVRARRTKSLTSISGYRAVLFASAALIGAAGYFGAALIYGLNHFVF